jgi:hypothetical protein
VLLASGSVQKAFAPLLLKVLLPRANDPDLHVSLAALTALGGAPSLHRVSFVFLSDLVEAVLPSKKYL